MEVSAVLDSIALVTYRFPSIATLDTIALIT